MDSRYKSDDDCDLSLAECAKILDQWKTSAQYVMGRLDNVVSLYHRKDDMIKYHISEAARSNIMGRIAGT